jgi:uncharacterized protein (TIGR02217 family)
MSFHDVRFPVDIAYGSTGGPAYSTDIVELASGYEQRNINWASARARYNVAHGVKTRTQLDELIAFFRARKGRAYGFRFKDWTDYSASSQAIGTGDGVAVDFQLMRHYASGDVVESRAITKPVSGTVLIYKNGVLQTSGYAINHSSGVVSFTSPPASGVVVTASFEFDVPVRFDTDKISAVLDNYGSHSWNDIPLVEVRI